MQHALMLSKPSAGLLPRKLKTCGDELSENSYHFEAFTNFNLTASSLYMVVGVCISIFFACVPSTSYLQVFNQILAFIFHDHVLLSSRILLEQGHAFI